MCSCENMNNIASQWKMHRYIGYSFKTLTQQSLTIRFTCDILLCSRTYMNKDLYDSKQLREKHLQDFFPQFTQLKLN